MSRFVFLPGIAPWRACAALALGLGLAACGGGGPGPQAPPVATELASLYVGDASSPGFVALVRGTGGGSHTFLAAHHATGASSEPVLYSGTLQAGVDGLASASLRTMRPNGAVRAATSVFTQVSVTQMHASFDAGTSDAAVHQAAAAQPLEAITGNWSGRWNDGLDVNGAVALSGLTPGASISLAQAVFSCTGITFSLGARDAGSGLFPVTVTYPATQTGCARQGTQLQGLAAVRQLGGQQRLQFVAVDANGSGVSFQADR